MNILAIETTGPQGSVAIINENGIQAFEKSENTMSHLSDLIPMVDKALKGAGMEKTELDYVAASRGPGSFTGIRIGVSCARALAQALRIECIGVPTLDAFLFKEEAMATERMICAIINARRGQVYGLAEGIMPAGPYMLTDVLQAIKESPYKMDVMFFGDGIDAYEKRISEELSGTDFEYASKEARYQDARSVARLAWDMAEREEFLTFDELLPDYMRKAEAEQKLEAGELPICKGPKQE